jgi:hypothetical protein
MLKPSNVHYSGGKNMKVRVLQLAFVLDNSYG